MANTIVSLFDKTADAQSVVRELKSANFTNVNTHTQADSGNITGTLSSANVPAEAARFYQEGVKRGGSLVTIRVEDNQIDNAMEIINRYNPVNINERSTQFRESGVTDFNPDQGATLQVVEEQLQVGKRQVERGGVRVYSHVTERPVEETVTLREEHVRVERRPVDRPISQGDVNSAFSEGTIEVTETSEEAIVGKQARVVEEVMVGKEVTERDEVIRDTVRRTDVEVEEIDTTTGRARTATNK